MKSILTWTVALVAVAAGTFGTAPALAQNMCADCQGCSACDSQCPCCIDGAILNSNRRAECYNWNRNYAHVQYGQPVALVVPPTANLQTNWGWGVGSMRVSRLDHQFGRNYPGAGTFGGPMQNTPRWPQDTNQFGVYSVRGPW
jgi:hypothetical protein